ncbi:hypothetical protein [Pseudomonas delhiensis]|uniref:hypothetical protein n=1 Tax=Pseudomonas delhiensis TaxID=366289 RepID=UPI003159AF36
MSVLKKYGVLADFSALEDAQLDRLIKAAVSARSAQDMTFATWCEQLLGPGQRVPIARFDKAVAGQTRMHTLADGRELAVGIKSLERQHQAAFKEAQRLQAEAESSRSQLSQVPARAEPCATVRLLRDWYADTTRPLHRLLWEIKEIEGQLFEQQGQVNRDYRTQLIQTVVQALGSLEPLGFASEVELRDDSPSDDRAPPLVLHRSRPLDEGESTSFEFVVEGIQVDVLSGVSEYLVLGQSYPAVDKQDRFNCYVRVAVDRRNGLSDDELSHLSCFLYKLFETMARSTDRRPRGALREQVILCLLLSCTAPCMPVRLQLPELHRLQDTSYSGSATHVSDTATEDPNLSAGKIVEYLLRVLRASSIY